MKVRFVDRTDAPPLRFLTCECGQETCLNDQYGDWTCSCHRDFNAFGQELKPRSQWEENSDHDDPEIPRDY